MTGVERLDTAHECSRYDCTSLAVLRTLRVLLSVQQLSLSLLIFERSGCYSSRGSKDTVIETIATIVIMAGSVLLFGYWFRYTCLLILHAKTPVDYGREVALANNLSFAQVQSQLFAPAANLDQLRGSLDRDFALVTALMAQASSGFGIEQRMLAFNYRMAAFRYQVGQHLSANSARQALEEMSLVVAHFANSLGEASAAASAA